MDVAQALANLMSIPQIPRTLSLPGPSTLTYEYLLELVGSVTLQPPSRAPVIPKVIASVLARAAQAVWWPTLSPDEVIRRYLDDSDVPGDWDAVGVTPAEIENHAITYLRRYRSAYVHIFLWVAAAFWQLLTSAAEKILFVRLYFLPGQLPYVVTHHRHITLADMIDRSWNDSPSGLVTG